MSGSTGLPKGWLIATFWTSPGPKHCKWRYLWLDVDAVVDVDVALEVDVDYVIDVDVDTRNVVEVDVDVAADYVVDVDV